MITAKAARSRKRFYFPKAGNGPVPALWSRHRAIGTWFVKLGGALGWELGGVLGGADHISLMQRLPPPPPMHGWTSWEASAVENLGRAGKLGRARELGRAGKLGREAAITVTVRNCLTKFESFLDICIPPLNV